MTGDKPVWLLVEDNPDDVELIRQALDGNGFLEGMQWVRDGVEAWEFVEGKGAWEGREDGDLPRLVVLDIKLPRLNGHELLERLKKDERTCRIPVVMLTTSKQPRDISQSYQAGVNSYVVKPVGFSAFKTAICAMLSYWLHLNENA